VEHVKQGTNDGGMPITLKPNPNLLAKKAGGDLPQPPPYGLVSSPHATTSSTGEVNAAQLCFSLF
jgi:hypothetical protein